MKIKFWYDREMDTKEPVITNCLIVRSDNSEVTGQAVCHEADKCVKDVGRKLALARALKNGKFSYAERAEAWKKYLSRDLK